VLVDQGKLDDALKAYHDSLAIRERLAAADRSNTGWQRDLSASYEKVGNVLGGSGQARRRAQVPTASASPSKSASLPSIPVITGGNVLAHTNGSGEIAMHFCLTAPRRRRSQQYRVAARSVGLVAQGKPDAALKSYQDSLAIRERLAAADRRAICRSRIARSATCWWRMGGIDSEPRGVLGRRNEGLTHPREAVRSAPRLSMAPHAPFLLAPRAGRRAWPFERAIDPLDCPLDRIIAACNLKSYSRKRSAQFFQEQAELELAELDKRAPRPRA
jgi:hypothetical protein